MLILKVQIKLWENWRNRRKKGREHKKLFPAPSHEEQRWGRGWSMGTVSKAAGVEDEDDEEEEKDVFHDFSLELHVFCHDLPKIPTGCSCQ